MQEKPVALATELNKEEEAYLKDALATDLSLQTTASTLNTLEDSLLGGVEILLPFIHSRIGSGSFEDAGPFQIVAMEKEAQTYIMH